MGNSPSKDEPSAKKTSNNNTSNGSVSTGEADTDEASSALSRSYPSLHNENDDKLKDFNQKSDIKSSSILVKDHFEGINLPEKHTRGKRENGSPAKLRKNSLTEDFDLDLEIGVSMAKLLSASSMSYEYGSSYESQKSEISAVSPIFTSVGDLKDEDSMSSSSSINNSPKYTSGGNRKLDIKENLGVIAERSIESTPEPRKIPSKSSITNKLSKGSPTTLGNQKLSRSISSEYERITKRSTDFDVDLIIDKLLGSAIKKSSLSFSKKHRDSFPLDVDEVKTVLRKSRSIFLDQPTMLKLSPSVKIVGDIHGQFSDLIRIFNSCGFPPHSNYLFLGDYVDRGHKSLETMMLLLCYKIKYPENFFMLRGNHESANITKIYGFYDECKRRLPSSKIWKSFVDVFNTLPMAATINDKIFCIHGGLSPELTDLRQIENIKRPTDIPDKGLLADLLWSDPDPSIKNFSISNWPKNDRGVSYCFGKKHVDYFCSKFNIDLIVRGHMVVEDGYEFFNKRKLVTVFSAPNYCGEFNNYGAVMNVDKSLCCSFELLKPQ